MRNCLAILFCSLFLACSTTYQPIEARQRIVEGQGGTRETVSGIDFWTFGDPPRRYEILGLIQDERGSGIIPMSQQRAAVASRAREVGGHAVIVLNSNSRFTGAQVIPNSSGSAAVIAHSRNTARFLVVKYLD